jgi:formylglycine-generating enzyme required for sulfatase activity
MRLRRVFIKGRPEWNRVGRGGYWDYYASNLRAADRYNYSPSGQNYYIGARLSRTRREDEA